MAGEPGSGVRTGWGGTAPGPTAWLLLVGFGWALGPVTCAMGTELVLHIGTAVAALFGGVALLLSMRALRRGQAWSDEGHEQGGFLATMGVMLSAVFLLGLVIIWVFVAFMDGCWY